MDTTSIKNYAPKARRDLIEAVTRRAAKYGITEKQIAGVEERGELYLIDGEAFGKREAAPPSVANWTRASSAMASITSWSPLPTLGSLNWLLRPRGNHRTPEICHCPDSSNGSHSVITLTIDPLSCHQGTDLFCMDPIRSRPAPTTLITR